MNNAQRKIHKSIQWQDWVAQMYPEKFSTDGESKNLCRTVTFQVTDACNLACTYCYQINKGTRRMSFETFLSVTTM